MFSIGENGDIFIHDDGTFTDFVIGDSIETEFRIARSRIISHFKHRFFLEKNFIKHLRNNFTDEQIKEKIDAELDNLFSDNILLKNKIIYIFKNIQTKFIISFLYKENQEKNRNLFFFNVDI